MRWRLIIIGGSRSLLRQQEFSMNTYTYTWVKSSADRNRGEYNYACVAAICEIISYHLCVGSRRHSLESPANTARLSSITEFSRSLIFTRAWSTLSVECKLTPERDKMWLFPVTKVRWFNPCYQSRVLLPRMWSCAWIMVSSSELWINSALWFW